MKEDPDSFECILEPGQEAMGTNWNTRALEHKEALLWCAGAEALARLPRGCGDTSLESSERVLTWALCSEWLSWSRAWPDGP